MSAVGFVFVFAIFFVVGLFSLWLASVDCDCGAVCAVSVIFGVVFIGVVFDVCVVDAGELYFLALSTAVASSSSAASLSSMSCSPLTYLNVSR